MHRKSKTIIIFSLTLILFFSICYAVLTSSLSVNGIFSFRENVWDVHFENVLLNEKSISKELPVIGDDKLSVSFNASLNKPFDIYEFSVDVVNNSSLDAAIQSIDVTGLPDDVLNYIEYSITYNTGTDLAVNNKLFSKAVSPINIKFKYKDVTSEGLSTDDINISPTISINYKQDDGTAVAVEKSNEWRFAYTGAEQEFTVPVNSTYKVELWGASGGNYNEVLGGQGGYTSGKITLTSNKRLYVYVGATGTRGQGGYNGGSNCGTIKDNYAGGGSGYYYQYNINGGTAGGLIGYKGNYSAYPNFPVSPMSSPGTQTSPGVSADGYNSSFGKSNYLNTNGYGTGGGSGYYAGGSGGATANVVYGGAGGSSFISGHNGCISIKSETDQTPRNDSAGNLCSDGTTDITCSYHYSDYKFVDTVMIDGAGYKWTTTKGSEVVGMPTHNGKSTMTGNNGNGYAKITYIG